MRRQTTAAGQPTAPREKRPLCWGKAAAALLLLGGCVRNLAALLRTLSALYAGPGTVFSDFFLRWAESACLLHGIDPMEVVSGAAAPLPQIGPLPGYAGTVPWAYSMGWAANFALLPYPAALALELLLWAAVLGMTFWLVRRQLAQNAAGGRAWAFGWLVLGACPYFADAFFYGNYGFVWALLIYAAMDRAKEQPVLAGLLLLPACMKPQLAGLFLLALLVQKSFVPVLIAGGGSLLFWLLSAFACQRGPLQMLLGFLGSATGEYSNGNYFGMFTPWVNSGRMSRPAALVFSALCGLGILAACWLLLRRTGTDSPAARCAATAIVSCFWFYGQRHDHAVLLLAALFGLKALGQCAGRLPHWRMQALEALLALLWVMPRTLANALSDLYGLVMPGRFLYGFVHTNMEFALWLAAFWLTVLLWRRYSRAA